MITWSTKDQIFVQSSDMNNKSSGNQQNTIQNTKQIKDQTDGKCLFAAVLCEQGCYGGLGFCVLQ